MTNLEITAESFQGLLAQACLSALLLDNRFSISQELRHCRPGNADFLRRV